MQTLRKPQGQQCLALLDLITHQPAVALGRLINNLDAEVGRLLESRLACLQSQLLPPGRPLGSFSTRLKLARALNWIDELAYRDLEAIRGIRNDFAHSPSHELSFTSQSVRDTCLDLRAANLFRASFDGVSRGGLTVYAFADMKRVFEGARKSFEISVEILFHLLVNQRSAPQPHAGVALADQVKLMFDELKPYVSVG